MGPFGMRKHQRAVAKEKLAPLHLANARQAAILLLWRIDLRDNDRRNPTTQRAQFTSTDAETSLWNRPLLAFARVLRGSINMVGGRGLVLLQRWGSDSMPLFAFPVRSRTWPRLGTAKIANELEQVAKGQFPFEDQEHLLVEDTTADRTAVGETFGEEDADDKVSNDE